MRLTPKEQNILKRFLKPASLMEFLRVSNILQEAFQLKLLLALKAGMAPPQLEGNGSKPSWEERVGKKGIALKKNFGPPKFKEPPKGILKPKNLPLPWV